MTFDKILAWAMKAKPRERLIYHKGGALTHTQKLHDYSDAVWGARYCYNAGLVTLGLKIEGPEHNRTHFYYAIKLEETAPPKFALGMDGNPKHLYDIPPRFLRKQAA